MIKPETLIQKQSDAWEDANCGELGEVAKNIFKSVIEKYVPEDNALEAVKKVLAALEYSSGCTGLVFKY